MDYLIQRIKEDLEEDREEDPEDDQENRVMAEEPVPAARDDHSENASIRSDSVEGSEASSGPPEYYPEPYYDWGRWY